MSAPAQVTEAHRQLVRAWMPAEYWFTPFETSAAQLIADSEAKAIAGQNAVIAEWLNRAATVSVERDQLRAEVERVKHALHWHENNTDACRADADPVALIARAEKAESAQLDSIASCEIAIARAEKAEVTAERYRLATLKQDAELAKERARLDWLLKLRCADETREDIDRAMTEAGK